MPGGRSRQSCWTLAWSLVNEVIVLLMPCCSWRNLLTLSSLKLNLADFQSGLVFGCRWHWPVGAFSHMFHNIRMSKNENDLSSRLRTSRDEMITTSPPNSPNMFNHCHFSCHNAFSTKKPPFLPESCFLERVLPKTSPKNVLNNASQKNPGPICRSLTWRVTPSPCAPWAKPPPDATVARPKPKPRVGGRRCSSWKNWGRGGWAPPRGCLEENTPENTRMLSC